MKKIIAVFICLVLCITCITGCGKKSPDASLIVGNWVTDDENAWEYTFEDGGTGRMLGEFPFTYTLEGDKLLFEFSDSGTAYEYTCKLKSDKLKLTDEFGFDTVFIRKEA